MGYKSNQEKELCTAPGCFEYPQEESDLCRDHRRERRNNLFVWAAVIVCALFLGFNSYRIAIRTHELVQKERILK